MATEFYVWSAREPAGGWTVRYARISKVRTSQTYRVILVLQHLPDPQDTAGHGANL